MYNTTLQAIQPPYVRLCFLKYNRMAFLQHFVDSNESFECLDFVGKDGLPITKSLEMLQPHFGIVNCVHFHAGPKRL
jgi:hypothetical protein